MGVHRSGRRARGGHEVNLKGFFADALSQALDLGIASADDVIRHVTPDLLATHLPRPLWARLLTACMGAPHVDAQLVIETIGIPNLCEHIPTEIIWSCISDVALRSLGREFVPAAPSTVREPMVTRETLRAAPLAMTPPPAPEERQAPVVAAHSQRPRGPSIPPPSSGPVTATNPALSASEELADVVAALEADERNSQPTRARTPTQQRFRQSNTGIGRLASGNRRPQAAATPENQPAPPRSQRRGSTEVTDYEVETEVGKEDWKNSLAVEDEQLVDWSAAEETVGGGGTDDYGRKR